MARASPVWKKLLFGGFAESKPKEGEWKVTLPEDSPQAMFTLLGIVHAKFDAIPRPNYSITLKELYDITILTDKYDLTHVLKPWASMWLQSVWSPMCIDPYSNMEQLWITWNMGDMARFSSAATLLALNMSDEVALKTDIAPLGVSDTILSMHQDALNRLLKPFHGLLLDLSEIEYAPNYVKGDTVLCCAQDMGMNKERCNLLMLGYFTRALRTASIIPRRKLPSLFGVPTTLTGSLAPLTVSETAKKLIDIIKQRPALSQSHINCCPIKNAVENITSIRQSQKFTPSEAQIKLLREQALKSGLA
ncbi:glycoprotein X [Apiospora arundinis]